MTYGPRPNPLAAAVTILKDDFSVANLVSDRIYGSELPRNQTKNMPRAAIVVKTSGGGSIGPGARSYTPWTVTRLDVTCYGENPDEAMDIHWAVYTVFDELERRDVEGCIVHNAVVTGGPISARDPNTDWPYVLGVYDLSAVLKLEN